MLSHTLNRVSFLAIYAFVVLLPVFFLPATKIPVDNSKGLLLIICLAFAIVFWGIARFFDRKLILARSWLLPLTIFLSLVLFLSALFSSVKAVSFFGIMFDLGSFWFIFSGLLLLLVSSQVLNEKHQARKVLFGLILSSAVLLIFQAFRLMLPGALSLGFMSNRIENLIGSWNSFGIFAGLFVILALFKLEFFPVSKIERWFLLAMTVVGLVFVAAANFYLIWALLGLSAIFVFVYKISSSRDEEDGGVRFPTIPFAVIIISLLFFIAGRFIGGVMPNLLRLSNIEIRPSISSTLSVAKADMTKNPVLGTGPNRFGDLWAMYKPAGINTTQFWNTAFNNGSGLITTAAASTGLLGVLAWILFLGVWVYSGLKTLYGGMGNKEHREIIAFFVASLYLMAACLFYTAGSVIFLLSLTFAGAFVGLVSRYSEKGDVSLHFHHTPARNIIFIICLVAVAVLTGVGTVKFVGRFVSASYFQKATLAKEIPEAEVQIQNALKLHVNDFYLRTYSQIYLIKLNNLASKDGALTEAEQKKVQDTFNNALNSAIMATRYNPENYLNFQMLGSIYASVTPLKVEGAYDKGVAAYVEASRLNPLNPGIKLLTARLHLIDKKVKEARVSAQEALTLKPDYIDGLVVMSLIEKEAGNNTTALTYAKQALEKAPNNEDLKKYVNSFNKSSAPVIPPETVEQ